MSKHARAPDPARARTRRRLVVALGSVLVVAYLAGLTWQLSGHVRGTATVAAVEHCESHLEPGRRGTEDTVTSCHGSWTLDGHERSGPVRGAREAQVGTEIPVRATATEAWIPDDAGDVLLLTGGLLVIVLGLGGYTALRTVVGSH